MSYFSLVPCSMRVGRDLARCCIGLPQLLIWAVQAMFLPGVCGSLSSTSEAGRPGQELAKYFSLVSCMYEAL
ncbi:hypothetical protein HZ326_28245 [Fusarium oxysporum f. sp. albedinis]|nr:hypothetical protein HZ326_28245 [Fusarium oxysporum f. sp. albedinis]